MTGPGDEEVRVFDLRATLPDDRRRRDSGGLLSPADPEGNELCANTGPAERRVGSGAA